MAFENHQQKINENMLIRYHSATNGTHQLHLGSVKDHLDPSRHLRSYQPAVGNHRDTSATFRDCQGPSVPIKTCLELSSPSQHPSGPISYIRGLSKPIWTHRDIFGAICLLSATIGTHQLNSMTVRNHLYPSTHVLVLVNKLQDPSTPVRSYVVPLRDLQS